MRSGREAGGQERVEQVDDGVDTRDDQVGSGRERLGQLGAPHDDPRRVRPNGNPYRPWHDTAGIVDGPVAQALGELARTRWRRATGKHLPSPTAHDAAWPDIVEPLHRDTALVVRNPAVLERPMLADFVREIALECARVGEIIDDRLHLYQSSRPAARTASR